MMCLRKSVISATAVAACLAAIGGAGLVVAEPAAAQSGSCAVITVMNTHAAAATVPAHSAITFRMYLQRDGYGMYQDVIVDNPGSQILSTTLEVDPVLSAGGWQLVAAVAIHQQCAIG
jgi:hypothetical protein